MKIKNAIVLVVLIFLLPIVGTEFAKAAPQGPDYIRNATPERRVLGIDNTTGGVKVQAQAGNVTALNINSTRLTNRWQGYYGNITGAITLDDALNSTLYNWELASPQGEIYASNGSESGNIAWANVFCFNYTNNLSNGQPIIQKFNGTDLERTLGAQPSDSDSINKTFNQTFSGNFQVGTSVINNESGCMQTTLFVNDRYQTNDFVEVLLTDNQSIIYTALLEQNQIGFQGSPVDFQMIVGENGDVASATTYYFFVELS
ncbi:MAG: hypothetical protein AABX00_06145 [Nanoarchaeota archaeon]